MICILNLEVVVLNSSVIDEPFLSDLKAGVSALINQELLPLFMNDRSQDSGIFGILNMCVANISSKLQLVKGVGV